MEKIYRGKQRFKNTPTPLQCNSQAHEKLEQPEAQWQTETTTTRSRRVCRAAAKGPSMKEEWRSLGLVKVIKRQCMAKAWPRQFNNNLHASGSMSIVPRWSLPINCFQTFSLHGYPLWSIPYVITCIINHNDSVRISTCKYYALSFPTLLLISLM